MAHTAKSINGITIRLPDERWIHITEEHSEMAGYLLKGEKRYGNRKP